MTKSGWSKCDKRVGWVEFKYEGELNEDRLPHGQGKEYQNGEIAYDGQWKDGRAHGQGKDHFEGKLAYEGGFTSNNKPTSFGFGKSDTFTSMKESGFYIDNDGYWCTRKGKYELKYTIVKRIHNIRILKF